MPYILQEVKQEGKKGFKVCKKDEPKKCFSKNPLPLQTAQRQRTAIIISELSRNPSKYHSPQPSNKPNPIQKANPKANAKAKAKAKTK